MSLALPPWEMIGTLNVTCPDSTPRAVTGPGSAATACVNATREDMVVNAIISKYSSARPGCGVIAGLRNLLHAKLSGLSILWARSIERAVLPVRSYR